MSEGSSVLRLIPASEWTFLVPPWFYHCGFLCAFLLRRRLRRESRLEKDFARDGAACILGGTTKDTVDGRNPAPPGL